MKKIARRLLIVILLSTALPIQAQNLGWSGGSWIANRIEYDASRELVLDITVTVSHSGNATPYFIVVTGGKEGNTSARALSTWNGEKLYYHIYDNVIDKNILKDFSDNPGYANVLSGSFNYSASTQYRNHTFSLVIPVPAQFPSMASEYSDSVNVILYQGTLSSPTRLWNDRTVNTVANVSVSSLQVCEVSIVDTNAPFDKTSTDKNFAFGTLTTGEKQSADIIVRSTEPYELRLNSDNNGVLARTDAVDPGSTIPYYCYINGSQVNLSSGYTQVASGPETPPEGDRHEIEIEIGDFWGISTGDYEDIIYVELISQ
ncbi:MAG: hypothetical protein JXR86_02395 [Spirochaetales bacterium]|nr:hypothetical protein [Spirochaetales bacterium]